MLLRGPSPSGRVAVLLVCAQFLLAACSSTGSTVDATPPLTLRGDPDVVARATELLAPRAAALADVQYVQVVCFRQETVAASDVKHVSGGPLSIRRHPPTMVFKPSGSRNLQILEGPTTRLVLDPSRRHATRWTYEQNSRAIAGVAALMLDMDVLAKGFVVDAVGPFESNASLTKVTLVPSAGTGLGKIEKIEIVVSPGRDVPIGLRVISRGGDFVDYELQQPNLNPHWRDPEVHFQLEAPPNYKVDERKG